MSAPARHGLVLAAAAALAALAPAARGGVRTSGIVKDFTGARPVAYRTVLYLHGPRLNCDTTHFTGSRSELIYDQGDQKIRHLDHAAREYVEIDGRIAGGVSDGVNKALGALGDLARKMRNEEAPAPLRREVRWTGRTGHLHGLSCKEAALFVNDNRIQEVWVADWHDAGADPEHLTGLKSLLATFQKVLSVAGQSPLLSAIPDLPMDSVVQADGFPLLFRHFGGGRMMYEIQLGPPVPSSADTVGFAVPEGYRRTLL